MVTLQRYRTDLFLMGPVDKFVENLKE